MGKPPDIALPDRLQFLIKSCEKSCVAECCGRDAFDFSPLHIASYLSAYSGSISDADVSEWELQVQMLKDAAADLPEGDDGFICVISAMNQYFSRVEFDALLAELRHSIRVAPQVVELSERLRITGA